MADTEREQREVARSGETVHDMPSTSAVDEQAEPHPSDVNGAGKLSSGSSLSPPPPSTPGPASTKSRNTPVPPKSLAAVTQTSDSTREILITIAQSAEDISRASNEKYYLARHVYDLVSTFPTLAPFVLGATYIPTLSPYDVIG